MNPLPNKASRLWLAAAAPLILCSLIGADARAEDALDQKQIQVRGAPEARLQVRLQPVKQTFEVDEAIRFQVNGNRPCRSCYTLFIVLCRRAPMP